MFSTILVPLDGSLLAEQALPFAERLARVAKARVILTRVVPPLSAAGTSIETSIALTANESLEGSLRDSGVLKPPLRWRSCRVTHVPKSWTQLRHAAPT
jgi:nucleotide-binding universal stress UspA family protein